LRGVNKSSSLKARELAVGFIWLDEASPIAKTKDKINIFFKISPPFI
jgi:hypothetical protein